MIKPLPKALDTTIFNDKRGNVISCNEFSMAEVERMYIISPASQGIIRAWQGHRLEEKWFLCISGSFKVKLISINDFDNPDLNVTPQNYNLNSLKPQILYIPGGYANGFKSTSEKSSLMVYSSFTLAQSKADDYRYPPNTWNLWEK